MEKIFDSHSHYIDPAFEQDSDTVLKAAYESGVGYIMNCGYNVASSKAALEQAEKYHFMYSSAGIHPDSSFEATQDDYTQVEQLLKQEKVKAVGECGLDYYYDDAAPHDKQKECFKKQLDIALKTGKPIIVHSRDAMQDTIDILKPYAGKVNGVIHCYSGSGESCAQLVKMGFYIGFTGVVTFKNARRAIESLQVVPFDRLLIETDCPYMAPMPFRGKRCDSSLLPFTVKKIAEVLGKKPNEVIKQTSENAIRLFNIQLLGD